MNNLIAPYIYVCVCVCVGQIRIVLPCYQGCPQVWFVPNPDSTRMHRVGKSLIHNRPVQSFGSASSGHIDFGSILVGFGFARVERNLVEFWPKYCRISPNLVGSNEIWPIFSYICKNRAEILMYLAEICLYHQS